MDDNEYKWAGDHFSNLEKLGEEKVRIEHAKFVYGKSGSRLYDLTENWLARKDAARASAAAARAETRSEEALSIARRQIFTARAAMITAIIAAMIAILSNIDKIINGLHYFGILKSPSP